MDGSISGPIFLEWYAVGEMSRGRAGDVSRARNDGEIGCHNDVLRRDLGPLSRSELAEGLPCGGEQAAVWADEQATTRGLESDLAVIADVRLDDGEDDCVFGEI